MDVIAVNWSPDGLSGLSCVQDALADLPLGGSVTIMIHGYRFSPNDPNRSPHHHILARVPRPGCWKAISWPRHLHLDRGAGRLGIAFGWPALGRLAPVAARAFAAGEGLARLISRIDALRPDLHVSLFAHSLGARVALRALRHAPAQSVHRAILLSGAEYRAEARRALDSPAGRHVRIVNVRSAENLPFDLAFRLCVTPPNITDLPLSGGLRDAANWTDLSIDCARTRVMLRALGHTITAPSTRFCHWSGYLRPGLFPLYRRLLDPSEARLLDSIRPPSPLPRAGGASAQLSPL